MAIDVKNMVQFYTGTTLPDEAVNYPNRVYFIKSGEVGSLYKGNVLIAQTNNDATIQTIQESIANLDKELDDHVALYNALVKLVENNTTAIGNNKNAIDAIKADSTISTFKEVETLLAGKQAAGDYATKDEAKGYADAKDTAIAAAQSAAEAAQSAADSAQAAADAAQGEVDALETYVGSIPAEATATDVIGYIQEKTSGIATDTALNELTSRIGTAEGEIDNIQAKLANIEGTVIAEIEAEVKAEADRAKGVESGLETRLKAVEDDYLKTADKTELTGAIATAKQEAIDAILGGAVDEDFDTLKEVSDWILSDTTGAAALQTDVAAIKADYLKSTDKEELEGKITAAQNAADAAQDDVDALTGEVEALSGVVNTKASQEALNTLTDRVTTAEADIDTLEGKMTTAEGNITNLQTAVSTKAEQADLTALTNRVTTAEGEIDTLQADLDTADTGIKARLTAVEGKASTNATGVSNNAADIATLLAALEWHQA